MQRGGEREGWIPFSVWLDRREQKSGRSYSRGPEEVRFLVGVVCNDCPWSFGSRDSKLPQAFEIYQAFHDHNIDEHEGRATKLPRYINVRREDLDKLNL